MPDNQQKHGSWVLKLIENQQPKPVNNFYEKAIYKTENN